LAIVFIPALVAVLVAKEKEAGRALTREEVEAIRDSATAMRVPIETAREMVRERGYLDLDPEDVWEEWLLHKQMTAEG